DASGGRDRIDAGQFWRAIAKYVAEVTPERFWQQLQQALVEATGGFKGPSVLLIPSDYFNAMVPPCPEDMRIAAIAACDNSRQKQGFQPDLLAQMLRQPLGQALRQALQTSRQP